MKGLTIEPCIYSEPDFFVFSRVRRLHAEVLVRASRYSINHKIVAVPASPDDSKYGPGAHMRLPVHAYALDTPDMRPHMRPHMDPPLIAEEHMGHIVVEANER